MTFAVVLFVRNGRGAPCPSKRCPVSVVIRAVYESPGALESVSVFVSRWASACPALHRLDPHLGLVRLEGLRALVRLE
jgi:hypothetical protein